MHRELVVRAARCVERQFTFDNGAWSLRFDPRHGETTLRPIDIRQLEQDNLADAKAQVDHAQRHGIIARAFGVAKIKGVEKDGPLVVGENLRRTCLEAKRRAKGDGAGEGDTLSAPSGPRHRARQ
mgnify:CR=1 FL=1